MILNRTFVKLSTLIAVIVLSALPILTYPLGPDQGVFATGAKSLLDGGAPFVNFWDFKPPAVFYVYSAFIAVFGQTVFAVRIIDLALFPFLAIVLFKIGRSLAGNTTGFITVAGFGAFYFTESFWTLTQNSGIALLPMALTTFCIIGASTAERPTRWIFAAGISAGILFWFKYPFLILPILLFIHYILQYHRDRRFLILQAGTFSIGMLLVLLGGMIHLYSMGAFDALVEAVQVTLTYTDGDRFPSVVWGEALRNHWANWGILVPLVLFDIVLYRQLSHKEKFIYRTIWVWLIAGILIMLVQTKGYDYHWLPILPPALILAAYTITAGANKLGKYKYIIATSIIGLLLVIQFTRIWLPALPYITDSEDKIIYYEDFTGGSFRAAEAQQVTDYLRQHTTPGDSLYVYGFHAQIYYLTDLHPATRFIFHIPLVGEWYPETWRIENVEQLWAALPPYVVVAQGDFMPWMTGRDADSYTLMREDTELINWLAYNYTEVEHIGTFLIWQRKTEPGL